MAEAQDIVHQIEYRWHDRLDLSPCAFSMSQESLRGWDTWIRDWIRHPHVDGLWESLCYQVQPNGRAAVAWRYEDWQAAERDDGTRGRPLVSRVLAAQANLLTPEVAIVLCRTGLPAAAGPRPGQVTAGTELPLIRAGELSALVSERAARLDQEAARQEGLPQVVASALSDQYAPLAIHVRGAYILKPLGEGMQCPLLWGLRRIVWPLVGTAGRGWSFSTFEPPLGGEVDPATLPDILFRQTQDTPPAAPSRPRKEIKSRPFDPSAQDDQSTLAQLAGWLVAEYQARGGDELRKVIADWCGAEHSVQPRVEKVYKELCTRHSPPEISVPPAPLESVSSARAPEPPPVPVESYASSPLAADDSAAAMPGEPALATGRPLEAEAAAPPPVPAVAGDQAGPGPRMPALTEDQIVSRQQVAAPDEALHEPAAAAPEDQVPDQEADEAPQADADRDLAQPGEQDRLTESGWFEEEDQQQPGYADQPADTADYWDHSRASKYLADSGHTADPADLADPRYRGDSPHTDTSARPLQPDVSSQPVTQDRATPRYSERTWASRRASSLGQSQKEGKAPLLGSGSQGPRSSGGRKRQSQPPPAAISDLLKRLPAAADVQEFESILRCILDPYAEPDPNDRVKARREVSKDGWYETIREKFSDIPYTEALPKIFQTIIIPDLDNPDATKKIAEWAEHARPPVIASLLIAARDSGDDAWHSMMQILQPKLAYRWMTNQRMQVLWDPGLAAQPHGDSGRRGFSFFRKS